MVEIKLSETNTFYVGQEAYIALKQHLSVGIKTVAKSNDDSIISVDRSRFKYFRPLEQGKKGADAGARTFVFKAHKAGSTELIIHKIFRGNLQEERSVKIKVIS